MIVIVGTLRLARAQADEFHALALPLIEATRRERGCSRYDIGRDLDDPGEFHIVEEWETDDAVTAHLASAHFTVFRQALAGLDVRGRRIVKYHVSEATRL